MTHSLLRRALLCSCSLLLAGLLSSCATAKGGRKLLSAFDEPRRGDASAARNDFYRLGPDDVIRITVDQHPEWSGEFAVKPNGRILIPDLGEIEVEGNTRTMLEESLSKYLAQFIYSPRVTVDTVKYASQVVYVLGEVGRPGKYPTEGKILTLRDAVITAGLPTRFARTGTVFIISPARRFPNKRVVNLDRILYHGEVRNNIEVKPGDIVYVPKNIWGQINDIISIFLSPLSSVKSLATVP